LRQGLGQPGLDGGVDPVGRRIERRTDNGKVTMAGKAVQSCHEAAESVKSGNIHFILSETDVGILMQAPGLARDDADVGPGGKTSIPVLG